MESSTGPIKYTPPSFIILKTNIKIEIFFLSLVQNNHKFRVRTHGRTQSTFCRHVRCTGVVWYYPVTVSNLPSWNN